MKNLLCLSALAAVTLLPGCVNRYGQFVPPDPIGRAIFNSIYAAQSDAYYYTYQPRTVVVTTAPPRPIYERRVTVVPAGFRDPVWIGGHYAWAGSNWGWRRGCYVDRPRPGLNWYGGGYYARGGRGYYRSGYWR